MSRDGETVAETMTDGYGDFKIDRLDPESGVYAVSISADGLGAEQREVTLGESISLGEIRLNG